MRGLSPVAVSGGHSSSRCTGLSLSRPLLSWSTGSRHAGSVVVAHGPSCSAACGIFPDQGSNPSPLHWQADSQPLRHQGSPSKLLISQCLRLCKALFQSNFYSYLHFQLVHILPPTDAWGLATSIWMAFSSKPSPRCSTSRKPFSFNEILPSLNLCSTFCVFLPQ